MDGAEVGFSRCLHGLGYTILKVESLGTKHLARPFLLLKAVIGVSRTFALALSLFDGIST